jgi:prolyl-tRNA synthetase
LIEQKSLNPSIRQHPLEPQHRPVPQQTTWEGFMEALERRHMVLAPWADEEEIEEDVKKRSVTPTAMGAKTLCHPFDQPELPEGTLCFASGKPAKIWALWGRSY